MAKEPAMLRCPTAPFGIGIEWEQWFCHDTLRNVVKSASFHYESEMNGGREITPEDFPRDEK